MLPLVSVCVCGEGGGIVVDKVPAADKFQSDKNPPVMSTTLGQ